MRVFEIIFWVCLFIVFYTYIGYGIVLFFLAKIRKLLFPRKEMTLPEDESLPYITLLICAYNEQDVVAEKMKNCNSLDYPKDRIRIMWVTDGSNDNTNNLLEKYDNVDIVFTPERKGKTAALNHGIKEVKTDIVVFTDANTYLNTNSMKEIVRLFQDPKVGCVSGEKKVQSKNDRDGAAESEGLYWKYESTLKKWDSDLYSAMGAAGELFAIRTALYTEMPEDTLLDDFIMSMLIVQRGYRIAYTTDAYAMEYGSANYEEEAKRKRRIAAGGIQSIIRLWKMLIPIPHPIVWFQYVSHRVLRWSITPVCLIILIITNIILCLEMPKSIYIIILLAQMLVYTLALLGYLQSKQNTPKPNKLAKICYYFIFMNINVFRGFRYLYKNTSGAWEKAKRS